MTAERLLRVDWDRAIAVFDRGRDRVLRSRCHVDDSRLPVPGLMTVSVGAETAVRPSIPVSPPPGLNAELANGAGRALRHLPDELLRAMVHGLRAHADDLAPGILFRGNRSGGCAVGITLRELAPDAFDFGLVRFWLWQRWRRGVERDVARRYPRLRHLQWYFDRAVAELDEAGGEPQPAKAVGLWLAASAQAELAARRRAVVERKILPTRLARRTHLNAGAPTRGGEHDPESNRPALGAEVRQ
jgi:hypothetical protein